MGVWNIYYFIFVRGVRVAEVFLFAVLLRRRQTTADRETKSHAISLFHFFSLFSFRESRTRANKFRVPPNEI